MRPRRRGPRGARGEEAVSVVVATVLLTGLVVLTMATVQRSFVPVWEQQAEVAHMQVIERQVAMLKSELDRQAAEANGTTVASPLSLARERGGWLPAASSSAMLSFVQEEALFRVASTQLRVLVNNGTTTTSINEQWTPIPPGSGGPMAEEAHRIQSLRLRFDNITGDEDGPPQAATLTVKDAGGNFAGDLHFYRAGGGDDDGGSYFVRVRSADATVLFDNPILFSGDDDDGPNLSPYWLNALNTDFRFDQVLAAAEGPYEVAVDESNLPGNFATTYARFDPDSGETVIVGGGGGVVMTNHQRDFRGGVFRLQLDSPSYVDQTYHFEHGAVILRQADGTVFKIDPAFRAYRVGSVVGVSITVPTLTGDPTSLAGHGTALVHASPRAGSSFVADAPRLTLHVETSHPGLWAEFWRGRLEAAGLAEGAGEFAVATGAAHAEVTIFGPEADPASTTYDLSVTFRQAPIELALQR